MSSTHLLILNAGEEAQIFGEVPHGSPYALFTTQGIGRVGVEAGLGGGEITVGFIGSANQEWIQATPVARMSIEALTPLHLEIKPISSHGDGQELIRQWLWDLHLVRHPVGAMARLTAFLQLMVVRFGRRNRDGYTLPFQLSHSRLAEVIGVTRSTATRLLSLLRQQGQLSFNPNDGSVLLAPAMMDVAPRRWLETPSED